MKRVKCDCCVKGGANVSYPKRREVDEYISGEVLDEEANKVVRETGYAP